MSPLFLGPGRGGPIHLPQLAAACGKGPRCRGAEGGGRHLSLSLFLSWSFQAVVEAVLGEGTGGPSGALAGSEHH